MEFVSTLESFTRIYLAVFFTGVAIFYTSMILYKKRQLGDEVVFPGQPNSCSWWNHLVFRLFRVTIWMVCLFRWPFPAIDSYLYEFSHLKTTAVMLTGNSLLTLGFLGAVVTNLSLGSDWRSGINPFGPSRLKTDGWFRYSRNPMFLSVAIAQLGFFFALPSLFTLICLVAGWVSLYVQVIVEEKHLSDKFGAEYQSYTTKVARWI